MLVFLNFLFYESPSCREVLMLVYLVSSASSSGDVAGFCHRELSLLPRWRSHRCLFMYVCNNIHAFLIDNNQAFCRSHSLWYPDLHTTFQINADTGFEDTYDALCARCVKAALAMQKFGVQKEDVIAICSYHHVDTCVPLLAAMFLGAKATSFDPRLNDFFIGQILKQIEPKILFVDPEIYDSVESSCYELYFVYFITFSGDFAFRGNRSCWRNS